MSGRICKNLALSLFFALLFAACAKNPGALDPQEKAFEGEDRMILKALDAEESGAHEKAKALYEDLYERSGKAEYLLKQIYLSAVLKRYEQVIAEVAAYRERHEFSQSVQKLLVTAYIGKNDLKSALRESLQLLEHKKSEENYEFVSKIYAAMKNHEMSVVYLQSAYALNKNPAILDQIATTMYLFMDEQKQAFSLLESHIRLHGCEKMLCERLANLYRSSKMLEPLLALYKKMYERFKNSSYAKKIAEIYIYKDEIDKAIAFLEKSGADNRLLIELYQNQGQTPEALALAQKMYERTQDLSYLSQWATLEYESASNRDVRLLNSVVEKLQRVVEASEDEVYLNYLGYILIDHELDINRGIKLVERALEKNPKSLYYLDSLAWGYYKKGECERAYEILKSALEEVDSKEPEIIRHLDIIKKCLKD